MPREYVSGSVFFDVYKNFAIRQYLAEESGIHFMRDSEQGRTKLVSQRDPEIKGNALFIFPAPVPFWTGCSLASERDDSCKLDYLTTATFVHDGASEDIDAHPPPYTFTFLDQWGREAKEYTEDVFTVRLSGQTAFYGYMIHARVSTRQRFLIGHLTCGQFVEEEKWEHDGIRFHPCPTLSNSTITNSKDDVKYTIEAKWRTERNAGPVQFVVTIIQTPTVYWNQWQPSSGFILPSGDAQFAGQHSFRQEGPASTFFRHQPPVDGDTDRKLSEESDESSESDTSTPPDGKRKFTLPKFNISIGGDGKRVAVRVIDNGQPAESGLLAESSTQSGTTEEHETVTDSPPTTTVEFPLPPEFGSGAFERRDEAEPSEILSRNEEAPRLEDRRVVLVELDVGADTTTTTTTTATTTTATTTTTTTTTTENVVTAESTERPIACDSSLCENNGSCLLFPKQNTFKCVCGELWTGDRCEKVDYCYGHRCSQRAVCESNDQFGNYTCHCPPQWAGRYCERQCPNDICQHGGNCTIGPDGVYQCVCSYGYAGRFCELDADDCVNSQCLNGATCVDHHNGYDCKCAPGYMGERCEKQCQDIYKSCPFWGNQQTCEAVRPTTSFFDINCPVTCGFCGYNATIAMQTPLPPILEPFRFLLGKWTVNSSRVYRFPLDFVNATAGYYETIEITPAAVIMFDIPSINFTIRSYNNMDHNDQQITVGFMTLAPDTKPLKVSMMSTGNGGVTTLEEGEMREKSLNLELVYTASVPDVRTMAPTKGKRRLAIKGQYLQEIVERERPQGQKDYFTKYFLKELEEDSH